MTTKAVQIRRDAMVRRAKRPKCLFCSRVLTIETATLVAAHKTMGEKR